MQWLKLSYLVPFLLFVALVVFLVTQNGRDPDVDTFSLLNKPIPDFSLPDLENPNQVVQQQQWLGRPYLLNVWATWCNSCAEEHAMLMQKAQSGVLLYGVLYKDQRASAQDYLASKGNPFHQVIDDEVGSFGIDLGVTGAPETFLVDAKGIIRYHMDGPIDVHIWNQVLMPHYQALLRHQSLMKSSVP